MRLFQIILMNSKSNKRCFSKSESQGHVAERRGGSNFTTEVSTGVMQTQVKDTETEAGRSKRLILFQAVWGSVDLLPPQFLNIPLLLSYMKSRAAERDRDKESQRKRDREKGIQFIRSLLKGPQTGLSQTEARGKNSIHDSQMSGRYPVP